MATITRIFLVHLKWPKWQLITFKLVIMEICLMFLIGGIYYVWVDYSCTNHMLPSWDSKVHDFMILLFFSLFAFAFEIYSKITDLDRTS